MSQILTSPVISTSGAQNRSSLAQTLRQRRRKLLIVGGLLAGLLLILVISAVQAGRAAIGVSAVLRILLGKVSGHAVLLQAIPPKQIAIVWNIRLPRILTAVFVGSGLAVSGAVFQALLMNPLAEPYTIGVSTGAAFGAMVAIYLNLFYAAAPIPLMPVAFGGQRRANWILRWQGDNFTP